MYAPANGVESAQCDGHYIFSSWGIWKSKKKIVYMSVTRSSSMDSWEPMRVTILKDANETQLTAFQIIIYNTLGKKSFFSFLCTVHLNSYISIWIVKIWRKEKIKIWGWKVDNFFFFFLFWRRKKKQINVFSSQSTNNIFNYQI